MSQVFVTTTARKTKWDPYALSNYERVLRAATNDKIKRHRVVASPADAEVILFIESRCRYYFDIFDSPIYKTYPEKCFLFDSQDNSIPVIPGLYTGIPEYLHKVPVYLPGFYLRVFDNELIDDDIPFSKCEYLFSFIGRVANCPAVRAPIAAIRHPRGYVSDSWSGQSDQDIKYAHILKRSKFVLCPRGLGASTWRLFETMKAARVPVIVSDAWRPPMGPAWDEFSVRLPEANIAEVPSILERLESNAEKMGAGARRAWEEHFSLTKTFDWVVGNCLEIKKVLPRHCRWTTRTVWIESLHRYHMRKFWREFVRERLLSSLN